MERFKIVVVGNYYVGKTSFIQRLMGGKQIADYKPTIGVGFAQRTVECQNVQMQLQFWDIAGQERFGTMTNVYYRGAVGAIIVYDVNDPASFKAVEHWRKDIDEKLRPNPDIPILLLGNKIDLAKGPDYEVPTTEAHAFSQGNGFVGLEFVSAKDGRNVHEALMKLLPYILENHKTKETDNSVITLVTPPPQPVRREGMCCVEGSKDD